MKILALFFASSILLFLSNCATTNRGNNSFVKLDNDFLRENGSVNPRVKGYWKSIGNGYILDASTDTILLYSYTKNFCYKEKNDYIEGLLNSKARFTKQNDTLSIYSADFGEKSNSLQIKHDYVRIDGLPKNHLSFSEMKNLGAKKLFTLFIETLEENYAFSRERNLNWDAIKTEFESKITKAIIVDVSFNFGGYEAASLTVASYFTEKPKLAFKSQVYNNGAFYDEDRVYIRPADKIVYTKPVYILMTDISRSQAEGFAMTMKANSNVTLVGTNTLGILSSMLGKSIGDFYSTSSNQRLLLPNGKYYEVTGVEPDIKMTVFSKENVFSGHKNAIRKIIELIEKQ